MKSTLRWAVWRLYWRFRQFLRCIGIFCCIGNTTLKLLKDRVSVEPHVQEVQRGVAVDKAIKRLVAITSLFLQLANGETLDVADDLPF